MAIAECYIKEGESNAEKRTKNAKERSSRKLKINRQHMNQKVALVREKAIFKPI